MNRREGKGAPMRIHWFRVLFLSLALIVVASGSPTLATGDDAFHALAERSLRSIHQEDYDHALGLCQEFIDQYPQNPAGYLFAAAVHHIRMSNYRVNNSEPQFKLNIEAAISKGERAVRANPRDAVGYYCLGSAYGYRGLHKTRKREWAGAIRDGGRCASNLRKATELNPNLHDARYGLGAYQYWRSAKGKKIRYLLFIRDERQAGIANLWQAVQRSAHSDMIGRQALVAIYYNEGDYHKAWEVNEELYARFPTNPSCLYMRGRILEQQSQWSQAETVFRRLLASLASFKYHSKGYQMECHYRIAHCLSEQGMVAEAQRECEQALQYARLRNPPEELEGPLEGTKEVLQQARELHRRLMRRKADAKITAKIRVSP